MQITNVSTRDAFWAALALALAAAWYSRPREVSETVVRTVPLHVVRQGEPVASPPLIQRITHTVVRPETVLVSLPGTDSTAGRFCAAVAATPPDTGHAADTAAAHRPAPARLLLLSSFKLDGSRLQLWGHRSDGSAYSPEYQLARRYPYLEGLASGDTAIVRQSRSWLPWGLEASVVAGVGLVVTAHDAGPGAFVGAAVHH